MTDMKTIEVEVAIMRYFGIRQNLIVPNVSWGVAMLHECDILSLSKSNYATEIEIKVSRTDLLKDKDKKHGHLHNHIAQLFFAVPKNLEAVALEVIPERAGLFTVEDIKSPTFLDDVYDYTLVTEQVRGCVRNKKAVKWSDEERNQLARLGTMRILGLKEKIAKR